MHKLVCDQDLALTVRIRDFNRRFGGLQVSPRLRFATAVLDLGEIMICGLDFPKYFLINSLITRSNF